MRRSRGLSGKALALTAALAGIVVFSVVVILTLGGGSPPIATQPTPTPTSSPTAEPTASPAPTEAPTPTPRGEARRVFLARDGLPPVAIEVFATASSATREERIASRLTALVEVDRLPRDVPAGAFNAIAPAAVRAVATVRVDIDLATVDITLSAGDWGVRGAARSTALLQQLVYTATEEPGIRRVLFTQDGGKRAVIDQLVLDRPLTREDVFGYTTSRGSERIDSDEAPVSATLTTSISVDDLIGTPVVSTAVVPALARFTVEVRPTGTAPEGRWIPAFTAAMRQAGEAREAIDGKWILTLTVPNARAATEGFSLSGPGVAVRQVDRTPVRSIYQIQRGLAGSGVVYEIGLDDARPWRATVLHDPVRIVVDIGGHPQAVSDSVAVYVPLPGNEVGREIRFTGLARAFEANVSWRLRASTGAVVERGNTTASIGTSALWGAFGATARVPTGISGNVTLEVFWASPRDGSDVGVVVVPLRIR